MLRFGIISSGILLLVIASIGTAQPPRDQGRGDFGWPDGMQTSKAMSLGTPEIQKELKLNDGQVKQVDQLLRDIQEQFRSSSENFNFQELQNLSQEEREKRFAEARRKIEETNKQNDEKAEKILDAKQLERFNQLQLQREGIEALNRPDMVKQLGLSEKQQESINKIQEKFREDASGGFGTPDQSEEDRRAMFTRRQVQQDKMQADIIAVMTVEQQGRWAEMKGKEFQFPQMQGRGPGGFGPGGFGPGGPGRGFFPTDGIAVTLESVKKQIRASDDEWMVIGPKMRKLLSARQAVESSISTANNNINKNSGNSSDNPRNRGPGGGQFFGPPGFGGDSFSGPSEAGSGGFGPPGSGPGGFGPGGFGPGGFGPGGFGPGGFGPGGFGPGGFGGGGFGPPGNPPPSGADSTAGDASKKSITDQKNISDDQKNIAANQRQNGNSPEIPSSKGSDSTATNRPSTATPAAGGSNQPPFGGPPGFGGRDSAVTRALADLQTALADTTISPEQLKEKVAAVRIARRKLRSNLQAAQKELLEMLTPDQEAVLLSLGYID